VRKRGAKILGRSVLQETSGFAASYTGLVQEIENKGLFRWAFVCPIEDFRPHWQKSEPIHAKQRG